MSFLCTHLPTTYRVPTTGIIVIYSCFQADALVLTLLSDAWKGSGFVAGILVCSLIMPQIISMEQHENTDYVFLYGAHFLSVISSAGLSASCLALFPTLATSALVFLADFRSQTLHFMSLNKEVIAAMCFIHSALRFIEKCKNQEGVVKQCRTRQLSILYAPRHAHSAGLRHQHRFHLKHRVQ